MSYVLTDRQWLWIAAEFYLVVCVTGTFALLRGRPHSSVFNYCLMLAGYLCQFTGLYLRGRAVGGCPLGNDFEILQFTTWSATTLYLLIGVTFRSSLLGHFTACLASVLSLVSLAVPSWDAARRPETFGGNSWIEFHAALALFSYGVFALLALTSLMLLLRNYSLKSKHVGGWFSFLPSILDLDHIGVRLLEAGVLLLTAALAVGGVWWVRDVASANVGKILVTVAVWAAYALVLGLRLKGKLLAARFAWTCVLLFGAVLVTVPFVNASRHPATVAAAGPRGR